MTTCPHCQQPIPDLPKSGGAGPILLWGGLGMLLGIFLTCAGVTVFGLAVSAIGSKSNVTFQTVGNSLSGGRR